MKALENGGGSFLKTVFFDCGAVSATIPSKVILLFFLLSFASSVSRFFLSAAAFFEGDAVVLVRDAAVLLLLSLPFSPGIKSGMYVTVVDSDDALGVASSIP